MSRLILTPAILCCLVVPAQAQRGGPSGSAPKITDIPTVVNPSSLCAYPSHPRRAPDGLRALSIEEAEPNDSVSNAQPIPVGDGENMDRDVNVSGAISSGSDKDTFRLTAVKGDVLGVACLGLGQMDPKIKVLDDTGNLIFENDDDFITSALYPPRSPFPGGTVITDSALTFVVPEDGDYHLRVIPFDDFSTGSYTLQIRSRRPSAETELNASEQQIIFLDFDGASINANDIFGFGSTNATLSPLSDFLPRWGLLPTDEDAVIDAIIAAFEENFDSLRLATLNGDRDTDNTNGHFDIEIQNSRDDTDVFDQPVVEPNFSRIIIGGTIDELGIGTIGIAQFIDPGNFSREDTAVVLLDLLSASPGDPNSLNQFNLSGGMSKIDLIGVGVGNVAAHEAGHYLGCWHTNNGLDQSGFCSLNFTPNLMDTGGCIEEIVGVGNDFQFGTADDINVGFVGDAYEPFEPIGVGRERTDVRVAFALATGIGLSISSETPSRGSELAALLSVAVVFTRDVTGVTAASLTVNGSAATNLTGSDRGPYLFEGFTPPSEGMVAVILSETGIEDSVGEPFTGDSWNYTILDTTSPTLSSEVPPRGSVVTDLSNIRVNMSESITGVVAGSLTVNGSAATAIAANDPNGDSYTFSGFALPDPGTVTVDFSGSGIMDVAGNAFSGATWTYELERESLTTDPDDSTLVLNLGGNVRIEPDESLTLGGSPTVSGGAPPYDLEWTLRGNPDVMSSTESNPVFGPASEGIYVVRLIVTDQDGATKIGYTTILVGEGGGTLGLSPTADPLVPGCGQTCAPNMGTFLSAMGLCYLAALRIRRRRRS